MHQLQEGGRAKVNTPPGPARKQDTEPHKRKSNRIALAACFSLTLLADQATKGWALAELSGGRRIELIGDVFQLRLVRNSGSAFGLFSQFPLVIFILNLGIMAVVTVWALRTPSAGAAFGLVLGGGLGNLADRVFRHPGAGMGEVVDFLYLSFWPTFNIADSAIVIGVGLLILDGMRAEPE